jgi:DNA-binding HxlR family transcriptional regulator
MQPRNSRTTNTRPKALATMTDVLQGVCRIEAVLSIIQKRWCVSLLRGEQNAREKQR